MDAAGRCHHADGLSRQVAAIQALAHGPEQRAGYAGRRPRFLLRARARRADHAEGGSLSTTPFGLKESRISTDPSTTATSTQPPLLDAVLLRHAIDVSSNPVTRTPSSRCG